MGFSDSMAGLGRSLLSGIGAGLEAAVPILAQAGATWVGSKIAPKAPTVVYGGGGYGPYVAPTVGRYTPAATPTPTVISPISYGASTVPSTWTPIGDSMATFPSTTYGNGYLQVTPALGIPGVDIGIETYAPGTKPMNGGCPTSPFGIAPQRARAQAFVVGHPTTGAPVWFKPAGRPVLWSDDLRACKRVARIAARAKRRSSR